MPDGGGSFFERIDELERQVGHGPLQIKVEIDQVYAKYQEFVGVKRRGGQQHYCRDGLYNFHEEYLQTLADRAVTEDGSDLVGGAIHAGVSLKDHTAELTPREFLNLARSGHVTVTDDGAVVYDRPPDVHRLSESELRAQRRHGHALDYGAHVNPRLAP